MASRLKLLFLPFLVVPASLLLSGCESTQSRDESHVPWARPASWEGAPAGMGDVMGSGRNRY